MSDVSQASVNQRMPMLDDASISSTRGFPPSSVAVVASICAALIIGGAELDNAFVKAARNIPLVDVLPQQGVNVYDILRRDVLVLSKDAAAHLEERLK